MSNKLKLLMLLAVPVVHAEGRWFTGAQEVEFTTEALSTSDILVLSHQALYSGTQGPWTLEVGAGWNAYDIDYSPVLFGTDEHLSEDTQTLNISLTRQWNQEWSGTLTLGAYDGYADYRSIWIAEFYKQFFGTFASYHDPDPHGQSAGLSAEWIYLPGSGSATFGLGFGRDEIAPGWSFDPAAGQPEPGRQSLDTFSADILIEQAVNPRLKTDLALTARHTSERDPRLGIVNTWVAAAGPFAFRLTGGYTAEAPSFDATYGSALVEWNFHPQWSARLGYRIYNDSGEIEASGFNALAPPVDTNEIFGTLLWDNGDIAVLASAGLLETDYEALSEDNEFFGNLYRDRDWWTFRLAASYRF
jgi:hypothetical protein